MKKILLTLLLLITANLFAQMGVTEFPKIGYGGWYWLVGSGHPLYYEKMDEVGFTHLVTKAASPSLNNGYGIKLMDIKFNWKLYSGEIDKYARAAGNHHGSYAYQVGGDSSATVWEDGNNYYGFGKPTGNTYSRWVSNAPGVGSHNTPNGSGGYCSYASVANDNQGRFLYAIPELRHFGRDYNNRNFKVKMLAKITNASVTPNDLIARVHIYDYDEATSSMPNDVNNNGTSQDNNYISSNENLTNPPPQNTSTTSIDTWHNIYASDFNSSSDWQTIYLGKFDFYPKNAKQVKISG